MNRWRLVYTPHDRLEIVDVERPGIEVSVPTHDVERMMVQHDLVDPVVLFHQNRKVSHLIDRLDARRARRGRVARGGGGEPPLRSSVRIHCDTAWATARVPCSRRQRASAARLS